jgi:hypothetical protein
MKYGKNKALLLIDVQKGFLDSTYWGLRSNPHLEKNISALLEAFRKNEAPVIHVQHHSLEAASPLRTNQPGVDFMDFTKPLSGEMIFTKTVNSAFIGTSLEKFLRDQEITDWCWSDLLPIIACQPQLEWPQILGLRSLLLKTRLRRLGVPASTGLSFPLVWFTMWPSLVYGMSLPPYSLRVIRLKIL